MEVEQSINHEKAEKLKEEANEFFKSNESHDFTKYSFMTIAVLILYRPFRAKLC